MSQCQRGCTIQGEHKKDCGHAPDCECNCHNEAPGFNACSVEGGCHQVQKPEENECTGCLPRRAAEGLAVCARCEANASQYLTELPELYVALAERARLTGTSKYGDPGGETPQLISDDRRNTRSAIKAHLVSWCLILEEDHRINLPSEQKIVANTRMIAAHHSDLAAQARNAVTLLGMPAVDGTPSDPAAVQAMRDQQAEHLKAAESARDDRETDRDIIRAIAEHINRHAHPLLANPDTAGIFVTDITDARNAGRRYANKSRPGNLRVLCECGERVTVPTQDDDIMRCANCGQWGTLQWWRQNISPPEGGLMTARDAIAWLLIRHKLDIGQGGEALIRQWASRHSDLLPRHKDKDGRRTLYQGEHILAMAQRMKADHVAIPA